MTSNERAIANARSAAVECSRRRLEAAEVQDYLLQRGAPVAALVRHERSLRANSR